MFGKLQKEEEEEEEEEQRETGTLDTRSREKAREDDRTQR